MGSQFFGLNIAYTGLLSSNASLNTTANNISNVETKGYSRQEAVTKASEAMRSYTTYGCVGTGVDVTSIERVRDEFYDVKYWNNQTNYGEYEKKRYYMAEIEDYLADSATVKGFTSIFNDMYNAMEQLLKNPGDMTTKSQFVGTAGNLTQYFNEVYENMTKMQQDINSEIQIKVDEINSYSQEIASLSKQINVIELTGAKANELRDQRTLILDKLSKVVAVNAEEYPVYDTNDPDRLTGANRFIVKIAGGQILTDTNEFNTLKCVARESYEKAYQTDAEGLYTIQWQNSSEFGLYGGNLGGELAGLIQMRDGNNGEYLDGTVRAINKDAEGNDKVQVEVPKGFLTDLDKCNLPGQGVINLANTLYYYKSWEFNANTNTYTFTMDSTLNDMAVSPVKVNKQATVNQNVAYQGIPYYLSQMNEWVRDYAKAFNSILTQDGSVDGYGNEAGILFTGTKITDGSQFTFRKEGNAEGIYRSTDDFYMQLNAGNIGIRKAVLADSELFATRTGASEGQDKCDVLEDLKDMKTNVDKMSYRGNTAGRFLECILADVALNADKANVFSKNCETMSYSIDNQRTAISGVDNDEEAANLVKYQHAYNMASKMIQILTEIYDRLILQTGV